MAFTIPTHFVQQYTTNVEMLLQQSGGKLVDCVTRGSYKGKHVKFIEQFGPITPSRNLPRHADTPLFNPTADARWVAPVDYDQAILIDDQDKLRMLIDPKAGYTMNLVEGFRRSMDDEILAAFFGPARTGENGTTTTNFPTSSQDVDINVGGSNSGLNVAKLRAAKKLMIQNGVNIDTERLYVILDARRHDELLNEIQVINLDYNTRPVLVDGRVTSFMGFNFKVVEFLSAADYPYADSTGYLKTTGQAFVPCWAESGMHFATWNNLEVDVGPRRDKRNSQQIYVTHTIGASRVQEKKVVRIRCNNT